jgi:hypothetical protein
MATTTKGLSAYTGVRYGITENTARLFMHKVIEAMKPSGNNPIAGRVNVDEFVVGGKDTGKQGRSYTSKKKKAVCAVELIKDGKVKRFYAIRIDYLSSKSLKTSCGKHIDKDSKVTTDEWKGYRPIAKDYTIEQVPSLHGLNFKALHTMIHQVKTWVRTTFSWISPKYINRYFDEFSYRINHSQSKQTIFNNLIKRMAAPGKISHKEIICS